MLTGILKYNDSVYSFIFDENVNELQLIPFPEVATVTSIATIKTMGITFGGEKLQMTEPFLIGITNENRKRIVFITIQGDFIKQVNDVIYIRLYAYFMLNSGKTDIIDKITFCSPEIDRIFNVNRALNLNYNDINDFNKKGTITISTNDFDSTSSQIQVFKVGDKEISVSFQIKRTISTTIGKPPLSLSSCLCFEFEATEDYSFLINLCRYARNFIRFLCFRKNIYFTTIDVYTPVEDCKHYNIGEICIFDDKHESEQEPFKTDRCIKYEQIMGYIGKILSDIVSNSLYLRHLPKTFEDSKHIDTSSFIMVTAAFEWEFHRNYPEGIVKSQSTIDAEEAVSNAIKELLNKSSGKQKEKYKFLLRLVKSDSMQSKIIQICKDYSEIIEVFGKHLYSLNQMEFDYKKIGKRVSDQRNYFAHGDLDKDFINESLLDVIFLEYIVYALQLRTTGLSNDNIRKSINDVFHLNFAL